MDDMIQGFVDESEDHITEISDALLDLEQDPSDSDAMDAIFRSAHTLKGNAGAMGFGQMSGLAHAMEDVLDAIREDRLEVNPEIVDDLFVGLDLWEEMLDEVKDDGEPSADPSEEIEMLRGYLDDAAGSDESSDSDESDEGPASEADVEVTEDVTDTVLDAVTIDTELAEDTDTYLIRAACSDPQVEPDFTVLDSLEDAFTVHGTHPEEDAVLDNDFGNVFSAVVSTGIPEQHIESAFADYDTIFDVSVQDITDRITEDSASESVSDDPEVDELLSGTSGLDERQASDEDPPDIEIGDLEDGDAGMFNTDSTDSSGSGDSAGDSIGATSQSDGDESETDAASEDPFGDSDDDFDFEDDDDGDDLFGDDDDPFDDDDGDDLFGDDDDDFGDELDLSDDSDGDDDLALEDDDADSNFDNPGTAMFEDMKDEVEEKSIDEVREEMQENGHSFKTNDAESVDIDALIDGEYDGDDESGDEAADSSALNTFDDVDEGEVGDYENHGTIEMDVDFSQSSDDVLDDGDDEDLLEDDFGDVLATGDNDSEDGEEINREDIVNEQGRVVYDDPENAIGEETELDDLFDSDDSEDVSVDTEVEFENQGDSDSGLDRFEEILREEEGDVDADVSEDADIDIQSIKVDVSQLDELYTLVQELVMNRIRLNESVEQLEGVIEENSALDSDADEAEQAFREVRQLETLTDRVQDTVMDIRLVPIEHATKRLPRIARDVARENDKKVDFEVVGDDVELDRSILSKLGDPLMHLVRNSVDHGVEEPEVREEKGKPKRGTVRVRARRSRDHVSVVIEDDGAGIEPDEVRETAVERGLFTEEEAAQLSDKQCFELIFRPGFSTKDEVTETSGRGVGMDVVYNTVQSVDGSIDVYSEPDVGTRVHIKLPVSMAIVQMLFVEVDGEQFGIPVKHIDQIVGTDDLTSVDGEPVHMNDGTSYPVIGLDDALNTESADTQDSQSGNDDRLIRIDDSIRKVALRCDEIAQSKEVVVEPYDGVLSDVSGLSGAVVLGQGKTVNILDVASL